MATEVRLIKDKGRFVPADHLAAEEMASIAEGEYFTAILKRARNLAHHRKFFALLHVIFENQSRYPTTEHLLDAIKIGIGHYDLIPLTKTKTVIKTRSISFAKMGQREFEQFWNQVVKYTLEEILPHTTSDELEARVMDLL